MQKINAEICFEFKKYRRLIMWWYNRQKKILDIRIKIFIGLIPTIGAFIGYWYMGSRDVLLENTAHKKNVVKEQQRAKRQRIEY